MGKNPARVTAIVGVIVLLVLALAAWFLVLGPRLQIADTVTTQAADLDLANLQLRNRYNQTLEQVAAAPEDAAAAQKLFATMPQAAELPTVLRQITDAADRAGIDASNIQIITTSVPVAVGTGTGPTPAGVNLASMDVGVTIDAPRANLLQFIDNMQGLDRALLLTGTQFTSTVGPDGQKTEQETLQATGSMFVLQSELPDLVADVEKLIAEAQAANADAAAETAG